MAAEKSVTVVKKKFFLEFPFWYGNAVDKCDCYSIPTVVFSPDDSSMLET